MATEVNLDKVLNKLDEKKMDELSQFLDHVSTLNEVLAKVSQLKDSGALDVLINFSYGAKSLRDALNDDAIQSIADIMSNLMTVAGEMKDRQSDIAQILENADTLKDAIMRLKALKDSGTLDVLINMSYALKSLRDALNDDAITNLASTVSNLMEVLSSMNARSVEGVKEIIAKMPELNEVLNRVMDLKNSGTLDVLINMSYALKSLRDALNDDAITNLGTTLSLIFEFLPKGLEFLNKAMSPPISSMIEAWSSPEAMKMLSNPENVTLGKLVTMMKDPDIQRGLGVMMAFLKVLGKNFRS
ncbi:DUF1641 domain-containing protein [Metallosphaera hakonensis]|uniref:DUF1641 domain-containing protein n=2 Tax=Metallosphaera hakonensis TaxID=79601 RepID=A0A2U9IX34_9CREN|nr:DUF1641 domain-containing protein [Metallosphaera hakonensis]AWS00554.1 DUF1641 domain-containing protein [Metallosphaera hakonensis JCM 8857 = DSM 7519]